MEINLDKVEIGIILLIIFLSGAYSEAIYKDNALQFDFNKVSNTHIALIIDDSGYAYKIQKVNLSELIVNSSKNIDINDSILNKKVK